MKRAKAMHSFQVWRRFAAALGEHRRALWGVGIASFFIVGLEILRPWAIAWIFDEALTPALDSEAIPRFEPAFVLWTGALGLLLVVGTRVAIEYWCRINTVAVGHAVTRSLRHRIFQHLIRLAPSFHQRHKSGDLLVRLMGDVPMLRTMLVDSTVELASRALLIVGTISVMFWKDAFLTGMLCIVIPLFVGVVRLLTGHITIAVRKQRRKEGELADYLHEALEGTEALQAMGRSDDVVRQFARSNRRSVRAGMKAAKLAAKLGASVETMIVLAMASCLLLGGFRVLDGYLSVGELLVFMTYVRSLLKPVRSASKHAEKISKGTACGERILAVLDESIDVQDRPNARPAPKPLETLEFEGVSHRYETGSHALHEVSVRFERGQMCGVFGASGAGKSTLAQLSVRLFDPSAGALRIDGVDIRDLEIASLRDSIGLCMQENVLFGETLRENLALGRPDASEEEMWKALEGAGADEFVRALDEGLDTELGSRGSGLSGGQRRRIVLARTLLSEASVLIVDEPFAGLDRVVAERVRATLAEAAKTRIVIVIAHEEEHLPLFDRIVVLEDGRLAGDGVHSELLLENEAYRRVARATAGTSR